MNERHPLPPRDADDPDAWVDDVKRWFYGGEPPRGDRLPTNEDTGTAAGPGARPRCG